MSLNKIPFILLATWGINMSYTPPNPPPPPHEHFSSSVPLDYSGYVKWAPITARVSTYSEDILAEKLTKQLMDRSYNSFLALLRYQLSWRLRTLRRLYPS